MKKQYPIALSIAAAGVLVGSLLLTGNFPGTSGQASEPVHDHFSPDQFPLDVKFGFKDREKGFDAIGSPYFYIDENFVDDENHCEFCMYAQYNPGTQGRAVYAFESLRPVDLSQAKYLTFVARGDAGGEAIKVYAVGKRVASPDGLADANSTDSGLRGVEFLYQKQITLKKDWVTYQVDLSKLDLTGVTHGFAFEMDSNGSSKEQLVFLDLLYYDTQKPDYAVALN